jgi:hypothetical protein
MKRLILDRCCGCHIVITMMVLKAPCYTNYETVDLYNIEKNKIPMKPEPELIQLISCLTCSRVIKEIFSKFKIDTSAPSKLEKYRTFYRTKIIFESAFFSDHVLVINQM